jgi:hypothetical protein
MRHPVTRRSLAATALVLLACASSPQHPDLKPPPAYKFADDPGPYSFDCDAPRGQYLDFSIRPPEGEIRITGWFRFIQGKIDVTGPQLPRSPSTDLPVLDYKQWSGEEPQIWSPLTPFNPEREAGPISGRQCSVTVPSYSH